MSLGKFLGYQAPIRPSGTHLVRPPGLPTWTHLRVLLGHHCVPFGLGQPAHPSPHHSPVSCRFQSPNSLLPSRSLYQPSRDVSSLRASQHCSTVGHTVPCTCLPTTFFQQRFLQSQRCHAGLPATSPTSSSPARRLALPRPSGSHGELHLGAQLCLNRGPGAAAQRGQQRAPRTRPAALGTPGAEPQSTSSQTRWRESKERAQQVGSSSVRGSCSCPLHVFPKPGYHSEPPFLFQGEGCTSQPQIFILLRQGFPV